MRLGGGIGQLGGNVGLLCFPRTVVLVKAGLHANQINHAAEMLLLANGQLRRDDRAAESPLQRCQCAVEAGAFSVHLIHHQHAREAELFAITPRFFGLHLHARHPMDQHQRGIGGHQGGLRFVQKNDVARRVNKIDFGFAPLRVGQGGADGKFALNFFFVVIRDGGAVVHFAQTVHHPRRKQQRRD